MTPDAWDLIVMFAVVFVSGVAVGVVLCRHRDEARLESLETALWLAEAENNSLKLTGAKHSESTIKEMNGSMEKLS